jgi:hypothetical protein
MTTLFKKLSITTLTLAIASGIVFSVGSSEPSTFEGQATTIPGLFELILQNETFAGTEFTVNKTSASLTVTFSTVGTTSTSFPLIATTTSVGLEVKNVANNHIREIRSISVNTSSSTSISLTLNNLVQPDGSAGTGTSTVSLNSSERYDTLTLGGSYPDSFSLTVSGNASPKAQINGLTITYDC